MTVTGRLRILQGTWVAVPPNWHPRRLPIGWVPGIGFRPIGIHVRPPGYASPSLFPAISTSRSVMPPALWLTQRSVTVSHEIAMSGW
jgi:hypothetical protein